MKVRSALGLQKSKVSDPEVFTENGFILNIIGMFPALGPFVIETTKVVRLNDILPLEGLKSFRS